ncbi:MAG: outer membrane lipoprotein carrier protein LolA [Alphaproteobacteria bacterium]|nr:outer membrane lipoprotein carrier protein LolA [Alphaproteobacteria bacterium]
MRLAPILAFAVMLFVGGSAAGQPAGNLSAQDLDDLSRVSAYLNSIESLTGRFTQVAGDGGFSQGRFYLKKPGRLRFEYEPPVPVLIVADGLTIAVTNTKLETQDRYPLVSTPLSILIDEDVNLAEDANIVAVERSSGQLAITAREEDGPAKGEITLIFSDPGLELRHWIVTDAEGRQITVALSELRKDEEIKAALFVIQEYKSENRNN